MYLENIDLDNTKEETKYEIQKKEIGERIRKIREEKMHYTKKKFASLINITPQYLIAIEAGRKGITVENIIKISIVANTTTDYLIFGKSVLPEERVRMVLNNYSTQEISAAFEIIQGIAALEIRENKRLAKML